MLLMAMVWTRAVATVRPWTDDYTNLVGSLIAQMKINWAAKYGE